MDNINKDILILLKKVKIYQRKIRMVEYLLIKIARERNITWSAIAPYLNLKTYQAAQQRYKRLEDSIDMDKEEPFTIREELIKSMTYLLKTSSKYQWTPEGCAYEAEEFINRILK